MTLRSQANLQKCTPAQVQAVMSRIHRFAPQGAALQQDSRAIKAGDVFVAFSGDTHDGRNFAATALQAGAICVLAEAQNLSAFPLLAHSARVIAVPNLKGFLGYLANAYYGHPSRALDCIAITGTNGKTTVTHFVAQLLHTLQGKPAGLMGTLGAGILGNLRNTGLTTPHASGVQHALAQCAAQGAGSISIEASSIGIAEGRLNGTHLKVAGFTNLTQDHLDYHGDMAQYGAAKRALFDWQGLEAGVINTDDAFGALLMAQLSLAHPQLRCIATGFGSIADVRATDVRTLPDASQGFNVHYAGKVYATRLNALGMFNVHNALTAVGCALALGFDCADVVAQIPCLNPVAGRMQRVGAAIEPSALPLVIVDYAHTPDGLAHALAALRPVASARSGHLHVVFGCGGERDASKRPLMGAVAHELADRITLTNDNPRSEMPALIAQQIAAAAPKAGVVLDRAAAIADAIANARTQDVVLIAGKGHETTQTIGAQILPFSDVEQAELALSNYIKNPMNI